MTTGGLKLKQGGNKQPGKLKLTQNYTNTDNIRKIFYFFKNAKSLQYLRPPMNCPCTGNQGQNKTVITIDKDRVHKILRVVKERKSPGPDNIGGRLLKSCAEPLSDLVALIFNKSLQSHRVPHLWKESVIVPVPKIKAPKSLNDFTPVALTSLIMKAFEKIIKQEILAKTQTQLAPLQFAYRAGRGGSRMLRAACSTQFLTTWKGQSNLYDYNLLIFHQLLIVFNPHFSGQTFNDTQHQPRANSLASLLFNLQIPKG